MNVAKTKKLVEKNGVITLRADMTKPSPEIDELLKSLGNEAGAIPYLAIFPSGRPNDPLRISAIMSSPGPVLDALEKAGPSKATALTAVSMSESNESTK